MKFNGLIYRTPHIKNETISIILYLGNLSIKEKSGTLK